MKKVITKGLILSALFMMFVLNPVTSKAQTNEGELTIVAHVTVNAAYKSEVLKALEAVVEGTRKEEGNVAYVVWEDTSNSDKLTIIEVWKSQQAIDYHNNTDHFKAFVKAIEGKADLEVYTMKKKF
ncbi:putative quinol monooxygenase [Parabacteroides sp. PF5-9]|uniref:putative quinol monooxygenase n=1 Tax=Parabacteroides sp. PF5-9 TaxID=1742404 RepID=UPI002474BFE8|nr:putative quinol monooxygenase [Parabacteroides sp. PF5-9]MDH6358439.1 quinol monooxygenase YgiN [Parabacteroides sp. PF5-9]